MLKHLYIKNYALISHLDIDFEKGFSVLTGETGAGKSIILGALGLLMGNRADSKTITEGEQKCIIEGTFEAEDTKQLERVLEDNEIDIEKECVIRREVSATGKSRAFVNDTPVQLTTLKAVSEMLIDIHSQHQNLQLKDNSFQLKVVDALAGNKNLLGEYEKIYAELRHEEKHLDELKAQQEQREKDYDYILFQLNQLTDANLTEGEIEALEAEQEQLMHAEEMKEALCMATEALNDDSQGAVSALKTAQNALKHIDKYIRWEDESLLERLESAIIELQDIAYEAQRKNNDLSADPERLEIVNQRIDLLNTLLLKHHKKRVDELIELREEYNKDIASIDNYSDEIAKAEEHVRELTKKAKALASQLTEKREAIIPEIEKRLIEMLGNLGIAHAQVEIRLSQRESLDQYGCDTIAYYFAANKNQTTRPIAEVASGGEIARIMLCLKAILSSHTETNTIIFDEIDTGVSGEVASYMAQLMQEMASKGEQQVITITHLPQIAAKGTTHYKVFKADNEERTETQIVRLNRDDRVREIARLLSGENITEAAMKNAEELLG